ncbi:MAG: RIP metalloprotease RseP, partial [Bryobacteraceae bacterium]
VHELGHYLAARYFDVRIEVFSFGFGPRLIGFRRGETDFRVSLVPFGGYVKMAGEQPGEEGADDPRAFLAKPRWQRLIIALAGPAMNIVLAVVLLTGLFSVHYQQPPDSLKQAVIGHVFPDSPAAKAGLKEGDRILKVDEIEQPSWEDLILKEVASANRPLILKVEREGQTFWTTVTPVLEERTGLGYAGWAEQSEIQIANLTPGMPAEKAGLRRGDVLLSVDGQPIRSRYRLSEIIRASGGKPVTIEFLREGRVQSVVVHPVYTNLDGTPRWMIGVEPSHRVVITRLRLPEAFRESLHQNAKHATLIFRFLRGIVERRLSPRSIEGPIGIARLSGEAAREGWASFVFLMAVVSLNLAVFNLLPIPILDGGVILVLLVEMAMQRELDQAVKEMVFKLGFVFLMAIVVFVLYNDIAKMLPG